MSNTHSMNNSTKHITVDMFNMNNCSEVDPPDLKSGPISTLTFPSFLSSFGLLILRSFKACCDHGLKKPKHHKISSLKSRICNMQQVNLHKQGDH